MKEGGLKDLCLRSAVLNKKTLKTKKNPAFREMKAGERKKTLSDGSYSDNGQLAALLKARKLQHKRLANVGETSTAGTTSTYKNTQDNKR